jgi:hypothetical protein
MLGDGLSRVFGTTRVEAAGWGEQRRDGELIDAHCPDEYFSDHNWVSSLGGKAAFKLTKITLNIGQSRGFGWPGRQEETDVMRHGQLRGLKADTLAHQTLEAISLGRIAHALPH